LQLRSPDGAVIEIEGDSDEKESQDVSDNSDNEVKVLPSKADTSKSDTAGPSSLTAVETLPDLDDVTTYVGKGKGLGKSSVQKNIAKKQVATPKSVKHSSDSDILKEIASNMKLISERRTNPTPLPKAPTPDELQVKSFSELIGQQLWKIPRNFWMTAMMDCMSTLSRYETVDTTGGLPYPRSPFRPMTPRFGPTTGAGVHQSYGVFQGSQVTPQANLASLVNTPVRIPVQQQIITTTAASTGTYDTSSSTTLLTLMTHQQQQGQAEGSTDSGNGTNNDVMTFSDDLYM
jgi:hypothetical protein